MLRIRNGQSALGALLAITILTLTILILLQATLITPDNQDIEYIKQKIKQQPCELGIDANKTVEIIIIPNCII